ncbi:Lacal_2735 family protein [Aquimarina sp. 2201CG1-2-11]|uniref:Lacal_2735 family protein n=1 Tax=Aquimarina discodermiae TaxID=3231043 RepID=UPI003461F8F5
MIRLFKKRSQTEILRDKFEKLMSQWHKLSSVNRKESDKKYAEAQEILAKLELLQKNESLKQNPT